MVCVFAAHAFPRLPMSKLRNLRVPWSRRLLMEGGDWRGPTSVRRPFFIMVNKWLTRWSGTRISCQMRSESRALRPSVGHGCSPAINGCGSYHMQAKGLPPAPLPAGAPRTTFFSSLHSLNARGAPVNSAWSDQALADASTGHVVAAAPARDRSELAPHEIECGKPAPTFVA